LIFRPKLAFRLPARSQHTPLHVARCHTRELLPHILGNGVAGFGDEGC
jgi:hypothetical protein